MTPIDKVLSFMRMLHQLQQIKRGVYVPGENRPENDVEHHYQLTLLAWYVAQSQKMELDMDKVLRYALVHDVVEVYAGDTDAFVGNHSDKKEREHHSAQKLQKIFPEFVELHDWIQQYENRADPESRFVYALDKLIPTLNNFLDNGRTWKERGITLEMVHANKAGRINQDAMAEALFMELAKKLKEQESELFPPAESPLKPLHGTTHK